MFNVLSLMYLSFVCCAMVAFSSPLNAAPRLSTDMIKIDQFGYLPWASKFAIITSPAGSSAEGGNFQVRRWIDDAVVFSGRAVSWNKGSVHPQSGDRGAWFDFSSLKTPGSYYISNASSGLSSYRFEIRHNVYEEVLKQAGRVFYHQRLGTVHEARFSGTRWADLAAYAGSGQDPHATASSAKGDVTTRRNLAGGWMDAGDANKYVTNLEPVVIQLVEAYRNHPAAFTDAWGIPESGNGLPDILDEVKWGLEFLKRMQDATGNGGLLLKVGLDTYDGDVTPPSSDRRPRYYVKECTSATLSGAAAMAAAGVALKSFASQRIYARDLVARAERAWSRARTATSNFKSFQEDCDTGDVKSGDADRTASEQLASAFVAAVFLYEATDNPAYKGFAEGNYNLAWPMAGGWWGPYEHKDQIALLRLTTLANVTPAVRSTIRESKISALRYLTTEPDFHASRDLYRAHMPDEQFHWGHNKVRAVAANLLLDVAEYGVKSLSNVESAVAQQHLNYLHGANPLGKVMLSNMSAYGAENSVQEIYHGWFADNSRWDNARINSGPPPGYLVGGPNKAYGGSVAGIRLQPPQKAYKDWNTGWPENSWELSEPSITYQSAYLLLLSRLMKSRSRW